MIFCWVMHPWAMVNVPHQELMATRRSLSGINGNKEDSTCISISWWCHQIHVGKRFGCCWFHHGEKHILHHSFYWLVIWLILPLLPLPMTTTTTMIHKVVMDFILVLMQPCPFQCHLFDCCVQKGSTKCSEEDEEEEPQSSSPPSTHLVPLPAQCRNAGAASAPIPLVILQPLHKNDTKLIQPCAECLCPFWGLQSHNGHNKLWLFLLLCHHHHDHHACKPIEADIIGWRE